MTKKYLITGGPGTGKSTLIKMLGALGEYTIEEAAEFVIKIYQGKGIEKPWLLPDFQDKILDFQIQWENDIYPNTKRVYIEGGILDGLAYAKPHTKTYIKILEASKKTQYEQIFLIESLGFVEKTKVRRESLEESIRLGKTRENIYRSFGYDPIRIPPTSEEQRLRLILEYVNLDKTFDSQSLERNSIGGKVK